MDLAELTGAPEPITLAGAPFLCAARPLKALGEIQAWLKARCPNPLAQAAQVAAAAEQAGTPLPPAILDVLFDHAQRTSITWPPRVGSRAWLQMIDDSDGLGEFLYRLLAPTNEDLSREEAADLAERATQQEVEAVISIGVFGRRPAPKGPGAECP